MSLRPSATLTDSDVKKGMNLIITEGLATEAMTVFTSGTFLIAMAVVLNASNFEIGLLAALPTLTNVFQLLSIWLVRRYNNRRAISVICSIFARTPLLLVAASIFIVENPSIKPIIVFLFFFYLFGSIAGPSWNSWMKDLIPSHMLGSYFSKRTSVMQLLNIVLSISLAVIIHFVRKQNPENEIDVYMWMFACAGVIGITGAYILSKVREPQSFLEKENIFRLLQRPLKDGNFRRLLVFNSIWLFAVNIATPFFTVFMMKTMGLSLPFIIAFTILGQIASIFTIRIWGRFADRYSNKTIIAIGAPLYILCLIGWCFAGISTKFSYNIGFLAIIHIFSGIATAGINLSLTNIGLKLAPSNQSIVYLSAKNIVTAFFSSMAPLIGGYLADYFTNRSLKINVEWVGPKVNKIFHVLSLNEFNFLFLIGAFLAFIALEMLVAVKETGEVEKDEVVRIMRRGIRNNLKDYFLIGHLITWQEQLWSLIRRKSHPDD
ncbi:MAG: MFS transporter [Chitinophagaceae bacterium]|nr:MFS transporter [Chitinophagaceae bacterium]